MRTQQAGVASEQNPLNEFVFLDDDKLTVEIVSWIVRKCEYQTKLFTDPEEAMMYLMRHIPKLLVVDFYMPGITGLEFLQRLQSSADLAQTSLYVCSAVAPSESHTAMLESMHVQLLEKEVVCDRTMLLELLAQSLKVSPGGLS